MCFYKKFQYFQINFLEGWKSFFFTVFSAIDRLEDKYDHCHHREHQDALMWTVLHSCVCQSTIYSLIRLHGREQNYLASFPLHLA